MKAEANANRLHGCTGCPRFSFILFWTVTFEVDIVVLPYSYLFIND